jgi:hypothetical protein
MMKRRIHTGSGFRPLPVSIVWGGCNECTGGGGSMDVYESFVLQTVACEDDTRAVAQQSSVWMENGVCT